jgi:predicted ATPase
VFARPEHPLAVFLDDLQWLDSATLDLMEYLLTQPDVRHLLLIGAYRDNEVDPAHPLVRKLQAMRQAGALLQDIVLAPLTRQDLEQLIADSLHCELGYARSQNWSITKRPVIHFSRSNSFLHFLKSPCSPLIISKGDGLGI